MFLNPGPNTFFSHGSFPLYIYCVFNINNYCKKTMDWDNRKQYLKLLQRAEILVNFSFAKYSLNLQA